MWNKEESKWRWGQVDRGGGREEGEQEDRGTEYVREAGEAGEGREGGGGSAPRPQWHTAAVNPDYSV